ncbi:MAG: transposase [Bdellovibrionales bacterium]|nr:transposase [Bdellovibrionales bacterium]
MPRTSLIRSRHLPYHVVARSNNRQWFLLHKTDLWKIFTRLLETVADTYGARVHAFVLMSNHIHLVLSTPDGNIDSVMQYLLRETTKTINRFSGTINHLFGGPYKWSLISDGFQFGCVIKYVFRNPVKAGICRQVEQYPWSTISEFLSKRGEECRFSKPCTLKCLEISSERTETEVLEWLNTPYSEGEDDCMRRALRRKVFQWKPDRVTRKLPPLFTK